MTNLILHHGTIREQAMMTQQFLSKKMKLNTEHSNSNTWWLHQNNLLQSRYALPASKRGLEMDIMTKLYISSE